jgi:UDP-2,3-diacylglucosamine pyrophosphatase LpxH
VDNLHSVKRYHVRSLFISDLHLGSEHSNVEEFIDMLSVVKTQNIFVVGDFIDFFHMYEHHGWSQKCNDAIKRILSKLQKGANLYIAYGNHDAFFSLANEFDFGNIHISKHFVHENEFINILVTHGDDYDPCLRYDWIVKLFSILYNHCKLFGIVSYIKRWVDKATHHTVDLEKLAVDAHRVECDAVVFGHTHVPTIQSNYGCVFYNTGDWMHNNSVIVETHQGDMRLLFWDGENLCQANAKEKVPLYSLREQD